MRLVLVLSTIGFGLSVVVGAWEAALSAVQEPPPAEAGSTLEVPGELDGVPAGPQVGALAVSAIGLGDQPVGTSTERTVTLTSTGEQNGPPPVVRVSKDSGFAVADGTCNWLGQSTSCEIVVAFSPLEEGPYTGELIVGDVLRITLSGRGVAAPTGAQAATVELSVWPSVMGVVVVLALSLFAFVQQRRLSELGELLRERQVGFPVPETVDVILSMVRSIDNRLKDAPQTKSPRESETNPDDRFRADEPPSPRPQGLETILKGIQDGQVPKTWRRGSSTVVASAKPLGGGDLQDVNPLEVYCRHGMSLRSLTEEATRLSWSWGSFVDHDGRFEFKANDATNKLIGFRMPSRDEFFLVLGEGTIWNLDFRRLFGVSGEEPRMGDEVFAITPASVRFSVDGTPDVIAKGVVRVA